MHAPSRSGPCDHDAGGFLFGSEPIGSGAATGTLKVHLDQRGRADFSGISTSEERLFIAVVAHKAFVDVNEQGTEAAAATGISMDTTAAPIEAPPVLRVDRPFIMLIRDRETGTVLFLARVADPR